MLETSKNASESLGSQSCVFSKKKSLKKLSRRYIFYSKQFKSCSNLEHFGEYSVETVQERDQPCCHFVLCVMGPYFLVFLKNFFLNNNNNTKF